LRLVDNDPAREPRSLYGGRRDANAQNSSGLRAKTSRRAPRQRSQQVSLEDTMAICEQQPLDMIALDQALIRLAQLDPKQSQLVELRFFGGLSVEETAEVMSVSPAT